MFLSVYLSYFCLFFFFVFGQNVSYPLRLYIFIRPQNGKRAKNSGSTGLFEAKWWYHLWGSWWYIPSFIMPRCMHDVFLSILPRSFTTTTTGPADIMHLFFSYRFHSEFIFIYAAHFTMYERQTSHFTGFWTLLCSNLMCVVLCAPNEHETIVVVTEQLKIAASWYCWIRTHHS